MPRAHLAPLLVIALLFAGIPAVSGEETKGQTAVRFPPAAVRPLGILARKNRPNLNRRPRLKRIGDPANLEPTITPEAFKKPGGSKSQGK